jgi:hypothetical protein
MKMKKFIENYKVKYENNLNRLKKEKKISIFNQKSIDKAETHKVLKKSIY